MARSSNGSGAHSKIVGLLGVAAAVFIGVTWILPKFERHHGQVLGFHIPDYNLVGTHPHHMGHPHLHHHAMHHHPGAPPGAYDTPALGPVANKIAKSGTRDYNLAGLAIDAGGTSLNGIA